MSDNSKKEEIGRIERRKTRAAIKRPTIVLNIRAIYALALRVPSEPDCVAQFLINAAELDVLWAQYEAEDDSVLDCLVELDKTNEYSADDHVELRDIVTKCKAIANQYRPVASPSDKVETQLSANQCDNIGDRNSILEHMNTFVELFLDKTVDHLKGKSMEEMFLRFLTTYSSCQDFHMDQIGQLSKIVQKKSSTRIIATAVHSHEYFNLSAIRKDIKRPA